MEQSASAKPSTPLAEHQQRPPSRTLGSRVTTPSQSQVRRGTPLAKTALEADDSLQPVVSEPVMEEMSAEERKEMLQQTLYHRKASRIQKQWRNFKLAKAEAKHIRTIQRLSKLNEAALLIQQWWRIHMAKKAAGITALFRTHQVNKLRTDPLPMRRKKAATCVWERQEAALRELSAVDTRRFWQETNFFAQSKNLLTSLKESQRVKSNVNTKVPYKGQWVPRKEAARLKERALEDFQVLKRRKAYSKKINPEKLEGRYELRVSASTPQPVLAPVLTKTATAAGPKRRVRNALPPRPASLPPLPTPQHVPEKQVAARQWNSSPWLGDAPWAEEPKQYRRRHLKSHLEW